MGTNSTNIVSHLFYGYSAERLSEWCLVPLRTAQRWKRGVQQPSKQAVELFQFHRDGQILSKEHWQDWRVRENVLVDPEGNRTTQGQLRAYSLVYQLAAELVRDSEDLKEKLQVITLKAV